MHHPNHRTLVVFGIQAFSSKSNDEQSEQTFQLAYTSPKVKVFVPNAFTNYNLAFYVPEEVMASSFLNGLSIHPDTGLYSP